MASDAAFTKETLVAARVGEPHRVGPFSVTLEGIRPVVGANWSALEAKLVARRGEGAPIVLRPQSRFFSAPPTVTSESAIAPRLDGPLLIGRAHVCTPATNAPLVSRPLLH